MKKKHDNVYIIKYLKFEINKFIFMINITDFKIEQNNYVKDQLKYVIIHTKLKIAIISNFWCDRPHLYIIIIK